MLGFNKSIFCSLFLSSCISGMHVNLAHEATESLKKKISIQEAKIAYQHNQTKKRLLMLEKAELENELLRREKKKLEEIIASKL